jgi:hypothetical protein
MNSWSTSTCGTTARRTRGSARAARCRRGICETPPISTRAVSFAVLTPGRWDEVAPFVEFMGYTQPWYSVRDAPEPIGGDMGYFSCYLRDGERVFLTYRTTGRGTEPASGSLALLDMTPYGRGEAWQVSPEGWPKGGEPCWYWRADANGKSTWALRAARCPSGLVQEQRRRQPSAEPLRTTDPGKVQWRRTPYSQRSDREAGLNPATSPPPAVNAHPSRHETAQATHDHARPLGYITLDESTSLTASTVLCQRTPGHSASPGTRSTSRRCRDHHSADP